MLIDYGASSVEDGKIYELVGVVNVPGNRRVLIQLAKLPENFLIIRMRFFRRSGNVVFSCCVFSDV